MELAANAARLTVRVAQMNADLRVLNLIIDEALAGLTQARLTIVSPEPLPEPHAWLARDVHVRLSGRYGERHLHGAVNSAARLQDIGRFQRLQLNVVPHAWWLTQRCRYRIFTDQSAVSIARTLWREAGLRQDDLHLDLRATPPVWQYRTQAGESEWDFLCRLFAELGCYWYIRQDADRHVLVVSDHPGGLRQAAPSRRNVHVHHDRQDGASEVLFRMQRHRRRAVRQARVRRYRASTPLAIQTAATHHEQAPPGGLHEHFVHHEDAPEAAHLAGHRLAALNADYDHVMAQGNRADLNCGEVVNLCLPDGSASAWLITSLSQQLAQPQVLEELSSGTFQHYQTLTAVPDTVDWRPVPPERPRLTGFWPALVTGPEPGKVCADDQGRIRVRFAWDPEGHPGIWLRVAQRLAGNRWGSLMLPRVGDEVSVLFIEGHPDTPVVAGRRYHRAHVPPQPLPAGQHQWMFRSRSGDRSGHELLLDDRRDDPHVLLHSSGQLNLRTRRHYQARIRGSLHHSVAGHCRESTDGAASERIEGNLSEHISGRTHLQAGSSLVLGGQTLTLQADGSLHLKGGSALLNSGQTVIFRVGGATVSCGPGGVSLSAPLVMVNMGGGGGAAASATPETPTTGPRVPLQKGALRTRLRPLPGEAPEGTRPRTPVTPRVDAPSPQPRAELPVPYAVLNKVPPGYGTHPQPIPSGRPAATGQHKVQWPENTPPRPDWKLKADEAHNSAHGEKGPPAYIVVAELVLGRLPEDTQFELSTADGGWTSFCPMSEVRQQGRIYEIAFYDKPPHVPLGLYVYSASSMSSKYYLKTIFPDTDPDRTG